MKKRAHFCLSIIALLTIHFNLVSGVLAASSASYGPQKYISYYKKAISAGRPVAAEMKLTEGIIRFPQSAELYVARATVRNGYLKKYDEALIDYNMAIRLSRGSHPKLFFRTGDIYFYKGMYSSAIAEYSKCLKLMPNYGKVYFKRAKVYLKIGDKKKARSDFINCMSYSPKYKKAVLKLWTENQL